jgi:hypothetical protein
MFLGHFGLALGAKRVAPGPSLGTAILAAQWADGIWPFFVLLGIERLAIAPNITRVTPLDFVSYPYSHSLVADVGWAIAFAVVYGMVRKNWRGAAWLGALVLSHWVLDVVAHRPDMPTWPAGPKLGLGLWNSLPGTLIVEFVLLGLGAWLYATVTKPRDRLGTILFAALGVVLAALFLASTFGPPPPSAEAVAITAIAGWLFVAWGYWIDRHRTLATSSRG